MHVVWTSTEDHLLINSDAHKNDVLLIKCLSGEENAVFVMSFQNLQTVPEDARVCQGVERACEDLLTDIPFADIILVENL